MTTYFEFPKLPGLKKFSAVLMRMQPRDARQMHDKARAEENDLPSQSDGELGNMFDAMMLLSKEHRNVLIMINIQGMRYAEVAEKLGTSVEAVRNQLSDARDALENLLMKDCNNCKAVS